MSRYSNIDHGNKRAFGKQRSFLKIKHLRLITPERANELGIPAEAPVLCSPYITGTNHCSICNIDYTPLIYQVDQTTEAQHFCKENGGGIYVQLPEDQSSRWTYETGLFTATVLPSGPIRMGNDIGYQFRSIHLQKINLVKCFKCGTLVDHGNLALAYKSKLDPFCPECYISTSTLNNWSLATEWSFTINADGTLSFSTTKHLKLPDNAGVLRR